MSYCSFYRICPKKGIANQIVWAYNHLRKRVEVWSEHSQAYVPTHVPNSENLSFNEISRMLCPDMQSLDCINEATAEKFIQIIRNVRLRKEEQEQEQLEHAEYIADVNGAEMICPIS